MNYSCHRMKRVDGKRWIPWKVISFSFLFEKKFLIILIVCALVILYLEFTPSTRSPLDVQGSEISVAGSRTEDDEIKFSTRTPSTEFDDEVQEEMQWKRHVHDEEEEEAGRNLNLHYYVIEKSYEDYNQDYTHSRHSKYLAKKPVAVSMTKPKPKEEMSCHLPLLNPFDESILQFIEDPTPIQGSNDTRYPLLFQTDLRSSLIQLDDPQKYGYHFCCYSSFQRADGHKSKVRVSGKCEPIKKKKTQIPEHIEFIQISCANANSTSTKHSRSRRQIVDMFGFIRMKPQKWRREINERENAVGVQPWGEKHSSNLKGDPKQNPKSSERKVNVVVFGVDSVSHMNFIRAMPQSYKFLTGNLSGTGLWGYTKVGDNTFPNILAAITGLFEKELDTVAHCWNHTMVFDSCSFIWKDFARQGYATAYGEDAVSLATFNFCKDGFNHQPTDYYEHTLTGHLDDTIGHVGLLSTKACYGPRLGFQVKLDFAKKMAVAMDKERRYFQFAWTTSLTHDNLNHGKHGDQFLLETLQWFKNEGYLEDTVFILMSDHGIRIGDIRDTFQGKVEERMPFLYFVFPQWFKETYPAAVRNVMENKHKLTTPFDLYETFQDLLSLQNIQSERIHQRSSDLKENPKLPRGISLFLEVPARRTCGDAEIPEQWCVCHNAVTVGAEQLTFAFEAGRRVVGFINEMFKKYPQCLKLELDTIVNAQVVDPSEHEDFKNSDSVRVNPTSNSTSAAPPIYEKNITFSLALSVSPSNGTFEATATRLMDGQWVISDEISRINFYGNQSHCVEDYNLKKFCFCS